MTNASKTAILETAAKVLAWELYSTAAYGRTRARVNIERFDRELCAAVKQWRATKENLNNERRKGNAKESD